MWTDDINFKKLILREDANKRFLGLSLTLRLAFFHCYLHKEMALLLLDYVLQLYVLGQLP